jgi:hypothetical protein
MNETIVEHYSNFKLAGISLFYYEFSFECLLKKTVARDFLPLFFPTNRPHIVPEFPP